MPDTQTVGGHKQERVLDLAIVISTRKQPARIPPYWSQLLEGLAELDVRAEIIGAEVRAARVRKEEPPPYRALLPSMDFVRALLGSSAPVFLCVEYSVATLLTAVAARLRGRRTIIFQEHRGREGLRVPGWERRYRRLLGVFVHAFIANTDAAFAELDEVLGIERSKIFRATLLVPPDRHFLSQDHVPLVEPTRRPLFVFVGRLLKRKNVGGLLEAAAELKARDLEFEVWIVGDGPQRQALKAQAQKLIDDGVVRFLGSCPNTAIGSVYDAGDVFVMPSTRDYRSVAVLEALRFGMPVIDSARDGNAGDSVRHELTGLIFDPCMPGALETAMERVITEIDLKRELAQRASALMEEQTPHRAAAALNDILAAVCSK